MHFGFTHVSLGKLEIISHLLAWELSSVAETLLWTLKMFHPQQQYKKNITKDLFRRLYI